MRKLCVLMLFMGFGLTAMAQEANCNDGIDNDNDGFIDCFDSDCGGNIICQGQYIGNDADCEIPQPPGSDFSMVLDKESKDHVSSTHGRFVIGDMGHPTEGKDGIPEVVTAHTADRKIYILDGQTLEIKHQATSPYKIDRYDIAIADVKNNGCAQIFIAEVDTESICKSYRNGRCREWETITHHYVASYDCQANLVWRTEVYGRPFTLALADFDQDGQAELYFKNMIMDAATGAIHINGSGNWGQIDGGPVAVDILDDAECTGCEGLELVAGGQIYAVNLNAPNAVDGGSLTLVREYNNLPGLANKDKWYTKFLDLDGDEFVNSQTSIADFDQDGFLDVLMTGTSDNGKTSVFYWNVKKNTRKVYRPGNNWKYGAGRLNLADLDGDGEMNVAFVTGEYLYALDENLDFLWRISIDEETSGYTSTTVFDFNNDGAAEIVYRDETYLYIIKGDGTFSPPIPCKSLTSNDYPIVADVDADGSTEICVICQDNFNTSNFFGANQGVIRTYRSGNEPWVSSRKVWNQHGYFNVNVNDDLTIPAVQQKHHLVFSNDVCGPGENRVLNSFLNQSAILNTDGCKTYPSADVTFVPNPDLINVIPPTCPDEDFLVSFTLRNIGSLDLTANIPISFYAGDPRLPGATKLGTEWVPVSNFKQGDEVAVTDMVVNGIGTSFTLFAVLNDDGTSVPTPIDLSSAPIEECNLGNNFASANVNPAPFQLTTSSTDHVQCGAIPAPPNGSVKVFKPEGATEQTVGYTFYWFEGTTAGAVADADYTGPEVSNLAAGTYSVYAVHDLLQCGSDTVQVEVGLQTLSISATANVDAPFTNCNDPDGQLSVVVDGVSDLSDYEFAWFEGTVFGTSPILSTSNVLEFAEALTYSVLVRQLSTGCETLESGTVPDLTVTPVVNTSFTPANCVPANSGEARADVGGNTSGYTFYWYNGSTSKPSEDFIGHTYENRTAGNYTVIARDNTTGCRSNETVVSVPSVTGITVDANITSHQTSCAVPNGAASASVGGTTAGYTFRWFEGDNTVNEIGTGPSISGLAAGDYTVEATSTATGCTDTQLITIQENLQIPTVNPTVVAHQSHCLPANGTVSATAAGSPGGYNFYWFDGNVGTPDSTLADHKGAVYTEREAGFYTVIAVDANTRCVSARAVVEVLDQTTQPVVTTSTVGQSSCDPANPDGQASANVGGNTTDYKFRWFAGADTTTFITENPELLDQAAGTYTVKAQDRVTGCATTTLVVINDISAKPTLSLVKQNNSVCDDGIGYTGSVTANFATNPNAQAGDSYTYEWRRNGVVIPGETASSVTGINAGTYSVTVRNERLGCVSDPASVVVNDAVILPALTTGNSGSTNCISGAEDGVARVLTVDGAPATTTGYSFAWTGPAGLFDVSANPTRNNIELEGVQGGTGYDYTVTVTNLATGCQNTAVVNVADAKVLPELSLAMTPNEVCDPALTDPAVQFNGTITTTVDNQVGALTNYTFALAGGTHHVQDASPNHNRFLELDGGITYTVTATHTPTGCESTPASIQVLNDQEIPVITTSSEGSTNCISGVEDGVARVETVDGNPATTAGYTFAWTGPSGLFDVSGNPTNAATALENVQGGAGYDYTVLVTNLANGCQNTAVVNVADAKVLPELSLAMTPNEVCDPVLTDPAVQFNGTITTTVDNQVGALTDYTFALAGGTHHAQDASPNHNRFLELDGDITYTVTATHTQTGCESTPASIQVLNDQEMPVITTSSEGSTNCISGVEDGVARVETVDGVAATTAGYTFAWTGPSGLFDVSGNPTNAATALENVQGGAGYDYTVLVTNLANGCQNTAIVNVADEKVLPSLSLVAFANTICDPGLMVPAGTYNGRVEATVVNLIGILDDYTFSFGGGAGAPGISPVHNTFNELNGDITYNATATHVPTGCVSDVATVYVPNSFDFPSLLTGADGSTNCDVALTNGAAHVVDVDGYVVGTDPEALTGFAYQWYDGNSANPANVRAGDTAPTIGSTTPGMGLQGGATSNFTVVVTRNADGCQSNTTVNIPDAKANPVISVSLVNNNTICDPVLGANGSLTAAVTYKGVPQGSPLDANWIVTWSTTFVGETVGGLAAGTYSATVMDTNTGCVSTPDDGTVLDEFDIPVITTTVLAEQTSCDPALPNGQLEGSATNGPAGSTLRYQWFEGIGTGGTLVASTGAQPSGAAFQTPNTLASMDYTFEARNEVTGCTNTATILLPQQLSYPDFDGTVTSVTSCVPTNGELDITLTTITDPTRFTIWYLDEVDFAQTGDPSVIKTNATYTSSDTPADLHYTGTDPGHMLIPGTYTVLVRDDITHCESNAVTFTVEDETNKTVAVTATVEASACNSGFGGEIDITVSPAGTYTFEWYQGLPTNSGTGFDFMNNVNPPAFSGDVLQTHEDLNGYDDSDAGGVGNGIYTVVVKDMFGCGKVFSETVPYFDAPDVNIVTNNSTQCDPANSDASVEVEVIGVGGLVYSVALYQGHVGSVWVNGEDDGCDDTIDNDGDGIADNAGDSDCGDGSVNTIFTSTSAALTGTAPEPLLGDYLVRVFDPAGGGCVIEKVVTLEIDPKLPQVTTAVTPSTACVGGVGDGTVEITVNKHPLDPTTPNYELVAIAPVNIGGGTPQGLPTGVPTLVAGTFDAQAYTLTVTDAVSGCSVDKVVNVPSQPVLPTDFVVTPTHDELCAPLTSGSALVTSIGPAPMTDYMIEWYLDNALTTPVTAAAAGGAGGELLTSAEVMATDPAYWPVNATPGLGNGNKTFYARAQKQGGPGDACYTPIVQVNINDTHVAPELVLTPFSNTSCGPVGEGRIEITASTASPNGAISGATYTYSWLPATAGTPANGNDGTVVYTIDDLDDGTYTVTALNEVSQCIATNSAEVLDTKFDIGITDRLVLDQDICPVGGQIDVTEIQINRSISGESTLTVNGGALSGEFTYQWFKAPAGSPGTFDSSSPLEDNAANDIDGLSLVAGTGAGEYPAMTFGTYYVIATRTNSTTLPGALCPSKPFRVDVADKRVFPTISFATVSSTACDDNFDGRITVMASTASGPGAGADYDFIWTDDPDGLGNTDFVVSNASNIASPLVTPNTDLVGEGSYSIRVTNVTTQCFTDGTVTVTKQTVPMSVTSVTPTHVDLCAPLPANGTGTINGVQVGTVAGDPADFVFTWADNVGMATPFVTDDPALVQGGLDVGTYYVTARRNAVVSPATPGVTGSGCVTSPVPFTVLDHRITPTISFATVSSTACDDNFDGRITVMASTASGPGAGADYDFIWTNDPDGLGNTDFVVSDAPSIASPLVTPNTDRVGEGSYSIRVTNVTTQCFTDGTVTVTKQTVPMSVTSVTPTHVDLCAPLPANGTGTINGVQVGTVAGDPADFVFTWADNVGMATPFVTDDPALVQGGLDVGTYYVTARRNAVVSPATPGVTGSGCVTSPVPFTVLDHRITPTISFATVSSTACDDNFDGRITVTASTASGPGVGANYDFVWTSDPDGAGLNYVVSDALNTPSAYSTAPADLVGPGAYTIRVTNVITQCFTDGTVSLQKNTVPVEVLTASSTPQQICALPADGSVTVALGDVRVGGNPVGAGITFEWFDEGGNSLGAGTTIPNLPIGSYYVQATRTAGMAPASGCVSAPLFVDVEDAREYPVLSLSASSNTTCNDVYDAQITLIATTGGIGSASNYDIDWTSDPGGFVTIADAFDVPAAAPAGYTTPATDNIGVGTYQVTVVNRLTQCSSNGSVTVLQNTTPVQIWNVAKIDQFDCAPFDGSITIDTSNPAHVSVTGDYDFVWEKDGAPLATPTPANILSGIEAGLYTVTGTKTSGVSAGCVTAPFPVAIIDRTQRPTIELHTVENFACDPALANGEASAVIYEGTTAVPAAGYTLEWFAGKNVTSGTVLGGSDVLPNLVEGDYTLVAVDNASPNRGCSNHATIAVGFDKTSFSIALDITNQSLCAPLQNGTVTVTGITETRNGVSTPAPNLGLFDYQWFDEVGTPHASTPAFTAGITNINNLMAGNYLVLVRNALGCISKETAAVVEDETMMPAIALNNYVNPAVCVLPEPTGYLQVSSGPNTTFDWFEGPDDSGTLVASNSPVLTDITYDMPLSYTVRARDNVTMCVNYETYTFSVDTVQMRVLASAVARTNCVVDNGTLFATTLDGVGALYDYEWYAGPAASGTPVYTTKEVTEVPIGEYTVIALHPLHDFCNSRPYTIQVKDSRMLPPVVVVQRNPLTHCDPANPDGVAYASVNGGVAGYTFDWFQGTVGGAPIFSGPEVKGLTATTYVVRATNVTTSCEQTASILIENAPVNVEEPTIEVISHHTNCVVPDGILAATVNGLTAGYLLQWYNGSAVRSNPDATGEFHRDLEDGLYTVTATDLTSGCVSDPVTGEVLPFREVPEFEIQTIPTNCEENVGGASLVMLNDVPLSSITWDIAGLQEFGARVAELPKGEFTVTVTTFHECTATNSFIIEPEVLVFNGISRNNDGQNDIFEIACIQDFPNNNVKIFNRAGTLVYEANGYDNQDVYFDGISNRGINLLGTELPDGTYFYIIDKRNGSKPTTGYLELLR